MPTPLPQFREDPNRCVYVNRSLGQEALNSLTPAINCLRITSDAPITVYIDSPGGPTYFARILYGLLKAPTQEGRRCEIVTVATGTAASAAADLLAAGDYALAYPHAHILFHGTRQQLKEGPMTKEFAASLAESLQETNEGFALELAERAFHRFFFQYLRLKDSDFPKIRSKNPQMTDVECMAEMLKTELERHADLPDRALQKHRRLTRLTNRLNAKWAKRVRPTSGVADFKAWLLKTIVDFELQENRRIADWSFSDSGAAQIQEDFVILRDYRVGQHTRRLEDLIAQWGPFCLDGEEQKEYSAVQPEEREAWLSARVDERIRSLWYFFVSICRFLQEGEHWLTAEEAYWFGLIDEVVGRFDLPCLRLILEAAPQQPTPPAADEVTGASGSSNIKGAENPTDGPPGSAALPATAS